MRWYLFMVWGVLIYYPISLVLSLINNFRLLDVYRNMMSRYDSSYYTTMFVFMLITIIIECVIFYFTLKARTELLDFKASGVKKLKVSIIVPGIYVVVMFFVYFIFVEKQKLEAIRELFDVLLNPNNFLSHGIWKIHAYIATYIAFVVGNIKYFNNRKNFFVN